MPPAADHWQRLEVAFHGAEALAVSDRAAYLDRVCGGDAALRLEVEAMLAADSPDCAFGLERLVQDEALCSAPDPFTGRQLGPWRVLEPIGRGGMGTVYLAERADGQYQQRVALKVVPALPASTARTARFQAERHILARVAHPNIARLLDAGFTPEGSAYLVMEHVDGSPITEYCDERRLTIDERVGLFRRVAEATQHAHQSLVVHRDLKPANIFVSHASGEVKLLDFGIAKLIDPDHGDGDATARELRVLTPGYAAPEQFRGDPVTTATDVYVLGVVLYELLTGRHPFDAPGAAPPSESAVTDPLAPSQTVRRWLASPAEADRVALARIVAARRTTGRRLTNRLDGDLDRIVLKALRSEPERRYASAGQLAEDLGRFLEGRPVLAQADTVTYRLRKFVGRHRVGVGMMTALFVVSTVFSVFAGLQARAVSVERDRARVEADRAARVTHLAADLFKLADPAAGRGDTITARELLDQAAARIGTELRNDAETQTALFNVLGRVYANLGLHDPAIGVLTRALDLQRVTPGDDTLTEAETLHRLGEAYALKGDYSAAEHRLVDALARRRRLKAPPDDVAATLETLGRVLGLTDRYDQAQTLLEEAVRIRRSQSGGSPNALTSGLYELGLVLHQTGDYRGAERLFREAVDASQGVAEPSAAKVTALVQLAKLVYELDRNPAGAEPLFREALGIARALYSADHPDVSTCLFELARTLSDLGRPSEAEAAAREAYEMSRRIYGDRHDETILRTRTLAATLRAQHRPAEGEPLLRMALANSRSLFGNGNPATLVTSRELAGSLEDQGRFAEALEVRRTELADAVKEFGEFDVYVAISLSGLGDHCLRAGQVSTAERYFRRALDVRQHVHPAGHWRIDAAHVMVGAALVEAGRFAAAEQELLPAYERLAASRGATAGETLTARKHLVALYEQWHRPADARRYKGDIR